MISMGKYFLFPRMPDKLKCKLHYLKKLFCLHIRILVDFVWILLDWISNSQSDLNKIWWNPLLLNDKNWGQKGFMSWNENNLELNSCKSLYNALVYMKNIKEMNFILILKQKSKHFLMKSKENGWFVTIATKRLLWLFSESDELPVLIMHFRYYFRKKAALINIKQFCFETSHKSQSRVMSSHEKQQKQWLTIIMVIVIQEYHQSIHWCSDTCM